MADGRTDAVSEPGIPMQCSAAARSISALGSLSSWLHRHCPQSVEMETSNNPPAEGPEAAAATDDDIQMITSLVVDGDEGGDRSKEEEAVEPPAATDPNNADADGVNNDPKKRRRKETTVTSENLPSSPSSSMELEAPVMESRSAELCSSLEGLLECVKCMVSSVAEEGDVSSTAADYTRLYELATDAHKHLSSFGTDYELGLLPTTTSDDTNIPAEQRERLRNMGRSLWMAVRSHPNVFVDNSTSTTRGSTSSTATTPPEDSGAVIRASSTGFVRLIAARLVLLNYISTKDQPFPTLIFKERAGDIPSPNELEFGLRSFFRAGRAIFRRGSVAREAYCALLLARDCWECINFVARGGDGDVNTAITAASVASKNLDDAFYGAALLPDAAHGACNLTAHAQKGASSRLVLDELKRLDKFVKDYCVNAVQDGQDESDSGISLSAIQRYLPCLARIAYKHGNRFAQYKDFSSSSGALKVVLTATNDCLAGIRSRVNGSSRTAVCQALQVQEQEMLVAAKQSLYVLSHVSIETGRADHAHTCLNQVEGYIEEQKARADEQYSTTMHHLNNDSKSKIVSSSFAGSDLLEGPKNQDKADIKARIETARAREKQIELKERANLAFSRIMLYHRASRQGREDGYKVDGQFKALVSLVLSISDDGASANAPHPTTAVGALTNGTKRQGIDKGDGGDVFADLLLRAAREIRTRRLVAANTITNDISCIADPYDILLEKVDERHPKHLFVVLDHLRSVLTAIQMLRETHNNDSIVFSSEDTDLDSLALTIAKQYVEGFQSRQQSVSKLVTSESTLFDGSNAAKDLRNALLQESRTQFSRALALYHCADDRHKVCHQWADYLIESLQLLRSDESTSSSGGAASIGYYGAQRATDQTLAELFSIKAYSLTESGEYTLGLRTARKAWEISERSNKPSVHVFGILFHAAVMQETKGVASNASSEGGRTSSCDALLELDSALSCLFQAYGDKTLESGSTIGEELLVSFRAFCNSCVVNEKKANGGGRLILGIQERWLKLFAKTDSIVHLLKNGAQDDGGSFSEMPGGASMLSILRHYLESFQNTMVIDASRHVVQPQALDSALESVLSIICVVRDRKLSNSASKAKAVEKKTKKLSGPAMNEGEASAPADYSLVWDDRATDIIIGQHSDCIWIAEQLWSMANLFASDKWIMSQLYARAHDFALLSEEEEGAKLTGGFLDCDYGCAAEMQAPNFSDSVKSNVPASSLSSEFSAQCLILSVANAVDDVEGARAANKDWAKLCLHRLALAYAEMEVNELHDEQNRNEVRPMLAHLTLRCLVELSDDEHARAVLADGSLLKCLCEGNVAQAYTQEEDVDGPVVEASDSNTMPIMLQNLYANAASAEANSLPKTAKILLQKCVDQFNESSGGNAISVSTALANHVSVGELQRKQIELASNVQETIAVFEAVDASVKMDNAQVSEADDISGEVNLPYMYSKDQLDWYAIEAHNRGCNLMSLGDIPSALRLIAVALNLLPSCSKVVASYGAEMRNTYSKLSTQSDRHSAVGHGNIVDLFSGGIS